MANGTLAVSQLEILSQSGTGIITIVPPATNTNRTLTLPDSTGTVATAESTLTQFNASGSAPVYACRAWVNFNGTGTVAIRASGNVSSITDNGTGNYTVNLTTAMPDTNYVVTALADFTLGSDGLPFVATNSDGTSGSKTTSAFGITSFVPAFNLSDVQGMYIAIFR